MASTDKTDETVEQPLHLPNRRRSRAKLLPMSALMELRRLWGPRPLLSVGATVLVQDEDGRVLLQRRGDNGLWSVPGGGLEPGETFLDAARRELHEETGLVCPDLAPLPLEKALISGPEFYFRYPNGDEIYLLSVLAFGTLPAAALTTAQPDSSGETQALEWRALDDLPPLSDNGTITGLNILRARVGQPALPLKPTPPAPPVGNHLRELRTLVGPRPLLAPGANVLVTDDRGRLLLLRHAGTGRWALPGGSLEPGESFAACAARELWEETALSAPTLRPLLISAGAEFRFTYPNGDVIDNVSVLYEAQGVTGHLSPQASEVSEAAWFAPHDLPGPAELSGPLIRAHVAAWLARQRR